MQCVIMLLNRYWKTLCRGSVTLKKRMSLGKQVIHRVLSFAMATALGFTGTFAGLPLAAAHPHVEPEPSFPLTGADAQLNYWTHLDQENPLVADFAIGPPISEKPLWMVDGNNPLLDADPFFMRSQNWAPARERCTQGTCYTRRSDGLDFSFPDTERSLRINERFLPVLETDEYIFMTAVDDAIFQAKVPGETEPGQGLFFISKRDVPQAVKYSVGVPIYFFPMPGEGWTGANDQAFEHDTAEQVIFYSQNKFGLPIDLEDVRAIEHVERQNLILAQTWSFLEGATTPTGAQLPRPNTTLAFGLILSGQLPNSTSKIGQTTFRKYAAKIAQHLSLVPQALAAETVGEPTSKGTIDKMTDLTEERLDELVAVPMSSTGVITDPALTPVQSLKSKLKRWIMPGVLYGGTAVAATAMYTGIDFTKLITPDMPQRILTVAEMMGVVLVASVTLKYTLHRKLFDKKYPHTEDDTWLAAINKEHKGNLDELVHMLWFSMASIPTAIRHSIDFLKDRFFPANKMVHKAWEATMGFQMRQSSRLAMNWKTFYLGSLVFGMTDSILVAVHLLIFTPFLIQHFGWSFGGGAAAAAFASSEVLRNFLAYLQSGAHIYSGDVKMIHLKSAETEAKRIMQSQGLNPDAARNEDLKNKLAAVEIAKRFKAVGLPGDDEFMYDPITFTEWLAKMAGFSADGLQNLTDAQKATLASQEFALKRRGWGRVKPALKLALQTAREAYKKAPSGIGAQVIALLQDCLENRSAGRPIVDKALELMTSPHAIGEMVASGNAQLQQADLDPERKKSAMLDVVEKFKGWLKYVVADSSREVRDMRSVIYLMSTSGDARQLKELLPESWKKRAGSEEAAILGAELIHRAYSSFVDENPELISSNAKLEDMYGERTNRIIERVSETDPQIFADPFTRQIRYWEILNRIKTREALRKALLDAKPREESLTSWLQWTSAKKRMAERLAAGEVDQRITHEWLELATAYGERTGRTINASDWAQTYRQRFIVAQEISRQVGLKVLDSNDSEFVRRVVLEASQPTEAQLATSREKILLQQLTLEDAEFYKAQLFSRHFISTYINLSVHDGESIPATSPEYPGIMQGVRRRLVGVPGGKQITKVVATVEAFWRNEDTSYAPGFWSKLDRSVPIVPDLYHAFIRNSRSLPYLLVPSYLTSYYVWQIHMPYALWAVMVTSQFAALAIVEFNNRVSKNLGNKPMADVPSKLNYAFLHSNLTNPQAMALQGFADPIVTGMSQHVFEPIERVGLTCAEALGLARK